MRIPWLLTLPVVFFASTASAGDPAAAQALFDQAKDLMRQGRYAEACPKFEESQRADAGLGTQFHLADCWQHLGRNASAWALFRDVESEAHALGENGRERVAGDRAAALEPYISKLVIAPHEASGTLGLTIRRDGTNVGREQWDARVPIDPGTHVVTVLAPRKQPWQATVDVPPNGKVVTVDLPPLADIPDALPQVAGSLGAPDARAATPSPLASSGSDSLATSPFASSRSTGVTSSMPPEAMRDLPTDTPVVENSGGAQRAVGWFLVGAGLAGLGAGTYFAVQWRNDRDQSDAHCPNGQCDPTGSQFRHDATTHGITSIATGGAGALSLIVGTVLTATAPGPRVVSVPTAQLRFSPVLEPRGAGLSVERLW